MRNFIILILLLVSSSSFCQDPGSTGEISEKKEKENSDKPSVRDRMFFGGSFGARFGDYTLFNISPIVGYKLSSTFSVGGGIIYQYSEDKVYHYSANNYGGRLFGIAKVYEPLFAQLEYEYLMYKYNGPFDDDVSGDYSSLFGGGGIAQPISQNLFFTATALYNFTYQNNYSGAYRPYNSPWVIRVGISAGF